MVCRSAPEGMNGNVFIEHGDAPNRIVVLDRVRRFLRKSLEHLEATGTKFEYWWPP